MSDRIAKMINDRAESLVVLNELRSQIESIASVIAHAFRSGRRLYIFGNGGSAADSQHMAAEFVGRFSKERSALPAMALTTDSSILTAIANDWSYDYVFKRQLEAFGKTGDVALGLSTSGESMNVLDALAYAKKLGMISLGITGRTGGQMLKHCDIMINVRGESTAVIQERQLMVEHMICERVEELV